jgi:hypothetical protein
MFPDIKRLVFVSPKLRLLQSVWISFPFCTSNLVAEYEKQQYTGYFQMTLPGIASFAVSQLKAVPSALPHVGRFATKL